VTTNFPSSIDAFTNPTSADTLDNPPHDQQHADINDAMEAVQAKVGVDGSAVTSSLDYKVAQQGLTLVKTQTVGTAVSSVTVTNAFSSTFENYRVSFTGFNCSNSSGQTLQLRLGNGGTIYAAGYYGGGQSVLYSGTVNTWSVNNLSDVSCCYLTTTPGRTSTVFDIHTPYDVGLATPLMGFGHGFLSGSWWSYEYASTARITDLYFFPSVGTMSGGTIRVYGYNNG
jgi:hypothetical protein